MNIEDRTFIWGLVMVLVCCAGLSSQITKLDNCSFDFGFDWVLLIGSAIGTISGFVKISDTTKSVLKNFADINQNLLVQPGQELKTISTMKNILAKAKIEEEFTSEFGIYDLSEFLGVLSLFKRPTFSFTF